MGSDELKIIAGILMALAALFADHYMDFKLWSQAICPTCGQRVRT